MGALRESEEAITGPLRDPENDVPFGSFAIRSSQTERGALRRPKGTGDDPFTIADPGPAPNQDDDLRLEGSPPDRFEGDRAQTLKFLTQFRRFMTMNRGATITHDPIWQCTYFVSLVDGPKVAGWAERSYDWLDQIKADPTMLPPGMTAWQVLEDKFRHAFFDYAELDRALDELEMLKMTEGRVDEYIAEFERLARRIGIDLDDPTNLRTFARGLPQKWANACIEKDCPESFEQWSKAAQRQQQIWLKIQALDSDYGTVQANTGGQNQSRRRGQFFWTRTGSHNQNQGRSNSSPNPARPRLPPRNDDAIDTSATIRKASTEREKEEYRKSGRCFACGKQGHIARNCPNKRPRVRSVHIEEENPTDNSKGNSSMNSFAARIARVFETQGLRR